jgi:putative ABC transport system permease protein
VSFTRAVPARAVGEVAHLPGVLTAEGMRTVPVRIGKAAAVRDTALIALGPAPDLRRVVDRHGGEARIPPAGLLLTRKLGELLGARPGDLVDVEIREGERRWRRLPVSALVDEPFGLQAYLTLPALHALLGEAPAVTAVLVRADRARLPALVRALERSPEVASIDPIESVVAGIRAQTGQSMTIITVVVSILAACIAVGVVYNNARISLAQRSRDLASLRVLGFSRREISAVLLGELAAQVLLGLPLGLVLGRLWAGAIAANIDPETIRLPVVISEQTHLLALGVAVLAAVASALWVRRRLDRLDLIAVLKTRE